MIHSLELANFKGIASTQRIEFAPLTLLFGANSAGKSTVLQALLYLHEVVERGSADVDKTELGGSVLELGGFARLVHRHEIGRAITLKAEFATPGSLARFGRSLGDFPFPDLDDEVGSAWLELTIRVRTTTTFQGPLVERAVIGVGTDPEPLVWIETGATMRESEPLNARVNLGHPLISEVASDFTEAWEEIAVPEEVLRRSLQDEGGGEGGGAGYGTGLNDGSGFGDGRSLPVFALSRSRDSALPGVTEPLRVIPFGDENKEKAETTAHVRAFLEMVVVGTTGQLAASLRDAFYIGPLRTIPPRGFLYERVGRSTSWGDGLAAWDLLLSDRGNLVERTNKWLWNLGAGCQIAVQTLFDQSADAEELAEHHVDRTVRRLLLDTGADSLVLPSEVGAGVSQVIPVIVAALAAGADLCMVEQPEIHVHPAVQVGLGDLFIDAAARDRGRRTLLVETHSEHLILRLLRRIRETTEERLPEGARALTADQVAVIYVERETTGVTIRQLRVDKQGEFKDRWPKGFFAERMEELL